MTLFGSQSGLEVHEYPQDFRTNIAPGQKGGQTPNKTPGAEAGSWAAPALLKNSKASKGIIVRVLGSRNPSSKAS